MSEDDNVVEFPTNTEGHVWMYRCSVCEWITFAAYVTQDGRPILECEKCRTRHYDLLDTPDAQE